MSRSNPHEGTPHPAVRWFEWNGEQGNVRYYDKEAGKNVDLPAPFTFMLLDRLGSVRGWHDASSSGIYSNEVKDTRADVLVVKAFKGGVLAEGTYAAIKDKVNKLGGQFCACLYIAFKHEGALAIGSLRIKGSALGAWMDFEKKHKNELYRGAISLYGFTEGKKGKVVFRTPNLKLAAISPESNNAALALDKELQQWMRGHLSRSTREQVEDAVGGSREPGDDQPEDNTPFPEDEFAGVAAAAIADDDIPF